MGADRISVLVPMIREVFDHAHLHPDSGATPCATFEFVGRSEAWVQVTPTEVNIAYPLTRSPDEEVAWVLRELPAAQMIAWEAGQYATWSFESTDPRAVAEVVDRLLPFFFGLSGYELDGKFEEL